MEACSDFSRRAERVNGMHTLIKGNIAVAASDTGRGGVGGNVSGSAVYTYTYLAVMEQEGAAARPVSVAHLFVL